MSQKRTAKGRDRQTLSSSPFERWHPQIATWAEVWGLPGLERQLTLETSTRMTRSLGRCYPDTKRIRIAAFLFDGPDTLIEEVLCHEVAHAAAWELYGSKPRPHGREWRELMQAAGLPARLRIPLPRQLERSAPRQRARWEHRCPRCRTRHIAGRPVRRWRCARCWEQGRSGILEIHRIEA